MRNPDHEAVREVRDNNAFMINFLYLKFMKDTIVANTLILASPWPLDMFNKIKFLIYFNI